MSENRLSKARAVALLFLAGSFALATLAFAVVQENEVGAAVYKKRCTMCHGENGVGDTKAGKMTKAPNITTVEWKNGATVDQLVKTLREGLGKMPKYDGKLSDEELTAVSKYTIEKFRP